MSLFNLTSRRIIYSSASSVILYRLLKFCRENRSSKHNFLLHVSIASFQRTSLYSDQFFPRIFGMEQRINHIISLQIDHGIFPYSDKIDVYLIRFPVLQRQTLLSVDKIFWYDVTSDRDDGEWWWAVSLWPLLALMRSLRYSHDHCFLVWLQ